MKNYHLLWAGCCNMRSKCDCKQILRSILSIHRHIICDRLRFQHQYKSFWHSILLDSMKMQKKMWTENRCKTYVETGNSKLKTPFRIFNRRMWCDEKRSNRNMMYKYIFWSGSFNIHSLCGWTIIIIVIFIHKFQITYLSLVFCLSHKNTRLMAPDIA